MSRTSKILRSVAKTAYRTLVPNSIQYRLGTRKPVLSNWDPQDATLQKLCTGIQTLYRKQDRFSASPAVRVAFNVLTSGMFAYDAYGIFPAVGTMLMVGALSVYKDVRNFLIPQIAAVALTYYGTGYEAGIDYGQGFLTGAWESFKAGGDFTKAIAQLSYEVPLMIFMGQIVYARRRPVNPVNKVKNYYNLAAPRFKSMIIDELKKTAPGRRVIRQIIG